MARYWSRFAPPGGLHVHFPTLPQGYRNVRWTGVYGIQIGPWFFGAIRGKVDVTDLGCAALTEEGRGE